MKEESFLLFENVGINLSASGFPLKVWASAFVIPIPPAGETEEGCHQDERRKTFFLAKSFSL